MKLEINLSQFEPDHLKDKMISLRIPQEDFKSLKEYSPNVSHTIRVLIQEFLTQYKKEKKQWIRK